jgi:hypothetical protein
MFLRLLRRGYGRCGLDIICSLRERPCSCDPPTPVSPVVPHLPVSVHRTGIEVISLSSPPFFRSTLAVAYPQMESDYFLHEKRKPLLRELPLRDRYTYGRWYGLRRIVRTNQPPLLTALGTESGSGVDIAPTSNGEDVSGGSGASAGETDPSRGEAEDPSSPSSGEGGQDLYFDLHYDPGALTSMDYLLAQPHMTFGYGVGSVVSPLRPAPAITRQKIGGLKQMRGWLRWPGRRAKPQQSDDRDTGRVHESGAAARMPVSVGHGYGIHLGVRSEDENLVKAYVALPKSAEAYGISLSHSTSAYYSRHCAAAADASLKGVDSWMAPVGERAEAYKGYVSAEISPVAAGRCGTI